MNKPRKKHQKTLGIALAGGGARGFVHIGILQGLEESGIKVSAVVGTSMGAIVGAAYCLGVPIKKMEKVAKDFGKSGVLKLRNLNVLNESLLKAETIIKPLKVLVGSHTFEDCKIPFQTVATDIESGKAVILKSGKLIDAIRASSAIPFILPPVFLNKQVLVDGGVIDNIPSDLLKGMKTDIKLAIDINNFATRQDLAGTIFGHYYDTESIGLLKPHRLFQRIKNNIKLIAGLLLRSFEIATDDASQARLNKTKIDLLLKPTIEAGLMDFDKAEETIKYGKALIQEHVPKIKQLLEL